MSSAAQSAVLAPDAVARLWQRDRSLWRAPAPDDDGDWLGWLDLPQLLAAGNGVAGTEDGDAVVDVSHIVVLGMGGSSLTAAVLADLFPSDADRPGVASRTLTVLDTVNPRAVGEFLAATDLAACHFLVASKSGTTIEPLSLEAVVRERLRAAGIEPQGRFTAITDAGTPLAARAMGDDFRAHVATPSNVGGRFSALSGFGMYPASLCGMPVSEMGRAASEMHDRSQGPAENNPGYELGEFLARNAGVGRDKLTILASESLVAFGLWLEQLVAESTGKLGRGLVPVVGEPAFDVGCYGADRQFVAMTLAGDAPHPHAASVDSLLAIEVPDRAHIGAEFFRWQVAVALAAVGLDVYPFDQPDVEAAKRYARTVLESAESPEVSEVELDDALADVCGQDRAGGYVALCAFLPESASLVAAFERLRRRITERTGMPTSLGFGPRYLHSTGQLHKGGTASVMQLVFLQDDRDFDLAVPGANYTLAELSRSQAVGDVLAMRAAGRWSEIVMLPEAPERTILSAADAL